MNKIFIIGSLNMDLVINAPYIPQQGETMHGSGFMTNPGGKGANQAAAVGKLGGNAYMVGCVGNAFGDELKSTLKKYKVNVDNVAKLDGVSSGIAVIIVVDGDNRIILDAGANGKCGEDVVDKAFLSAEKGDYVICQLEISQETVKYAFELAKQKGMITVLNPAPSAKLINGILNNIDYFIPNQSETEFYTGIYPSDESAAVKCAEILKDKGVKNVIITMGKNGSLAICGEECIKVPAKKVVAVDTTAAGDTFVGALITSICEGNSLEYAMNFATKASAVTVTRAGAQQSIPTRDEIGTIFGKD